MSVLRCRYCNDSLDYPVGTTITKCWGCSQMQTVPSVVNEENSEQFLQALALRNAHEFDKAYAIYSELNKVYEDDLDIYWEMILCKMGICYEVRPRDKLFMPIIYRLTDTSVFEDENYKKIMASADATQKPLYRKDAIAVYDAQNRMLEDAKTFGPSDVVVCCNSSSEDSFFANEIASTIKGAGYKVFNTAEIKGTVDDEPAIFSAVKTSKVMVVYGSRKDYLEDVNVANIWRRYVNAIKDNKNVELIVAYRTGEQDGIPAELSDYNAVCISGSDFKQVLKASVAGAMESIKQREEDKARKEHEIAAAAQAERDKVLDELMARVEEINKEEVEYTNEDHNDYDKQLEMVLRIKRRYEEALSAYEVAKDEHDSYESDYNEFKKKFDENPLHEESKKLQDLYNEKAAEFAANVYFRKETKKRDQKAVDDILAHLNEIRDDLDQDIVILEGKRKNLDMKRKMMIAAESSMNALKKQYEKERSELRSYDDIVKGKRKNELLMEAEMIKHSVGDTMEIGCWPDNEKIEWTIIDTDGNRVLLLSNKIIDAGKFHDVFEDTNWSRSFMRRFLNGEFLQKAFTDKEKESIAASTVKAEKNPLYPTDPGEDTVDKIFLLSVNEVRKYLEPLDLVLGVATPYALSADLEKNDKTGGSYWWLRTPGNAGCNVARVSGAGMILEHGFYASDHHNGIRPAMWVTVEI